MSKRSLSVHNTPSHEPPNSQQQADEPHISEVTPSSVNEEERSRRMRAFQSYLKMQQTDKEQNNGNFITNVFD